MHSARTNVVRARIVGSLLVVVLAGLGSAPQAAEARAGQIVTPTLDVSPATGLTGGQEVTVSAGGYTPGHHGRWCQGIDGPTPGLHYCGLGTTQSATVGADGTFHGTIRLQQFIYVGATQNWVDCTTSYATCVISSGTTEAPDTGARRTILFAPRPAPPTTRGTITVTPTSVRPDEVVTVSGSGFRAGARVDLRQCEPNQPVIWPNWCTMPKATAVADASGAFRALVSVQRVIAPPGQFSADCGTTPPSKPCTISAAESVDLRYTAVAAPIGVIVGPTTIAPGSASVAEGDESSTTLRVPVTLSAVSDQTVSAQWTTVVVPEAPAGQADPATDYAPTSGTVTFDPGETTASIELTVFGDHGREVDEYVVVAFHSPQNATLGGFWGLGFGGITNDDPLPQVVPGGGSAVEGDAGTATLAIPVTLSAPSSVPVTVHWTTVFVPDAPAGQATPVTDYDPTSGAITFAPGETTASASVTIDGDQVSEPDEYVVVAFHTPTDAVIGGYWGLGFGLIEDDD